MRRTEPRVPMLAERLCRPQRVGIFGHRGVGKTTLLTMLYREAVGGRLPGLRLAAADAATADYLSGKILQLESGQPLPATLAETALRFQLYHESVRLELLVKDYQGEHVELGREEPIHEFLRDCDAVWLCLDAATVPEAAERLRRQQEIEQLIEDYLAAEPGRTMERPVALVLTKADLLGPEPADVDGLARDRFGMTRHALALHCPNSGLFAVSSLVREMEPAPAIHLQPRNLAEPLTWLAGALQAQDEARLDRLWSLAGRDLEVLTRCLDCFAHRYPDAPATQKFRQRLKEQRRQRRRRRAWLATAGAACLLASLWTYDAMGYHRAERFEAENASDPAAALTQWHRFQFWHPTRNVLGPGSARQEQEHLRQLEQSARSLACAERQAQLRRQLADPDADPEAVWRQYHAFHAEYPEVDPADLESLRAAIKANRDDQLARQARQAFEELVRSEQQSTDLPALAARAEQLLRQFPGSAQEAELRRRLAAYGLRLDERDIEVARIYSAKQPLNFQTRREHYQRYLDQHAGGGAFRAEAEKALDTIAAEWDKHDFRAVRDHFEAHPGDIQELVARGRTYLAVHPRGRFTAAAADLLRWTERVTAPGEYKVVLRQGEFEKGVARFFSRGPKLSVELEVNGVRYGPSSIVYNHYDPEWNYEYPRRIRWKLGESVRIRVTEHSWKDRVVMEIASADGDPVGIKLLTGEVASGPNRLTFESDFTLPALPKVE